MSAIKVIKAWLSSGRKIYTFSTSVANNIFNQAFHVYLLVAFRQRIGEEGVELILQESIRVNDPPKDENAGRVVSVDTTVQEKNITYPTDDKLYKKIIKKCWIIAGNEKIDLRQSYTQVVKKLGINTGLKTRKMELKQPGKQVKK